MSRTIVTCIIDAPVDLVFKTISDIENLPNTIPDVESVEISSDIKSGVGTRFCEVRITNGKKHLTELEVIEYVENERIRMVADSHGTIWDSVFVVRETDEGTELKLAMDANAQKLLPKLINPLMKGFLRKGLEKHMKAVKAFCERA